MNMCSLFGWFDPCGRKEKIAFLEQNNDNLNSQLLQLQQDIQKLQDQLKDQQVEPDPNEEYWDNKRPKAYVTYKGRYLPNTSIRMEIPVQLYVTPQDPDIIADLIANNLMVTDPKNCDDIIVAVYKHTRTKPSNPYRYAYDDENVGVPEFWYLPFELRFAKKGDCDDWGNELASYLIAAGVPRFRVRCVCGYTWSGYGHHTVYVLQDDMKTWRHINSTTPISMINENSLDEFPLSNDESDDIGIKDVWFSFNDKYAWHEFETAGAQRAFSPYKKLFRIEPWNEKKENGLRNRNSKV